MKQFQLKWGHGNIKSLDKIYKTMIVDANSFEEINPIIILPDSIKSQVHYIRVIFTSEAKRNYDYGSWSEFIEAEEIK